MSADPDQTLHNAASDQGLHCLHIKFLLKVEKYQTPLFKQHGLVKLIKMAYLVTLV